MRPAPAVFAEADTVLAYGGNEAIAQVRAQVPVTTRFLGYGHKLGFGLIARAALDAQRGPATARLAAHDIVRYEQQGCYSPHHFYVERGGRMAPREFALHLAGELANLQRRFPRRALALEEAAAVSGWRQGAELQALAGDGVGGELFGEDGAASACLHREAKALAPTAWPQHPRERGGCARRCGRWWPRTGASCRRPASPPRRPNCSGWPELLGGVGVTRIAPSAR